MRKWGLGRVRVRVERTSLEGVAEVVFAVLVGLYVVPCEGSAAAAGGGGEMEVSEGRERFGPGGMGRGEMGGGLGRFFWAPGVGLTGCLLCGRQQRGPCWMERCRCRGYEFGGWWLFWRCKGGTGGVEGWRWIGFR